MSSAKGRKKTTGRCESRAELVESVWYMVQHTPASIADVARALRVSHGTVHNILRTKEGKPQTGMGAPAGVALERIIEGQHSNGAMHDGKGHDTANAAPPDF